MLLEMNEKEPVLLITDRRGGLNIFLVVWGSGSELVLYGLELS